MGEIIVTSIAAILIIVVFYLLLRAFAGGFDREIDRQIARNAANEIFKDLCNPKLHSVTYNFSKGISFTINKEEIRKKILSKEEHAKRKIKFEEELEKYRKSFPNSKKEFAGVLPREIIFALFDTSKDGLCVAIIFLEENVNPNIGVHVYNASSGFSYSKMGHFDFSNQ